MESSIQFSSGSVHTGFVFIYKMHHKFSNSKILINCKIQEHLDQVQVNCRHMQSSSSNTFKSQIHTLKLYSNKNPHFELKFEQCAVIVPPLKEEYSSQSASTISFFKAFSNSQKRMTKWQYFENMTRVVGAKLSSRRGMKNAMTLLSNYGRPPADRKNFSFAFLMEMIITV